MRLIEKKEKQFRGWNLCRERALGARETRKSEEKAAAEERVSPSPHGIDLGTGISVIDVDDNLRHGLPTIEVFPITRLLNCSLVFPLFTSLFSSVAPRTPLICQSEKAEARLKSASTTLENDYPRQCETIRDKGTEQGTSAVNASPRSIRSIRLSIIQVGARDVNAMMLD